MTGPAYHGRTHHPDGTDPIPGLALGGGLAEYPWIRRQKSTGATIADSSADVNLTYESSDGSATPDYTDYFDPIDNYRTEILVSGLIAVTVEMIYTSFTDHSYIYINDGIGSPSGFYLKGDPNEGASHAITFNHRWKAGTLVYVTAAQDSSGSRTIFGYTELVYLGSYTGTDPDDANPDQ